MSTLKVCLKQTEMKRAEMKAAACTSSRTISFSFILFLSQWTHLKTGRVCRVVCVEPVIMFDDRL